MNKKTFYTSPASQWVEAQPLGNGRIGAMVYGGTDKETVCLNHDTLWSGRPKNIEIPNFREGFEKARELALAGNYAEAHKTVNQNCLGEYMENYLPFGDLEIEFCQADGEVLGYSRTLDLENALLTVGFSRGGVDFKREYFVSYPDDVLAIKMSASVCGALSFSASLSSKLKSATECDRDILKLKGECPGQSHNPETQEDDIVYFDEDEKRGVLFCGALKVHTSGGETVYDNGRITVKGADKAVLILSIKTSFGGYNIPPALSGIPYEENAVSAVNSASKAGYQTLLDRHKNDFSEMFNRISLDLGKSGREDMPTDQRLLKLKEDGNDISLYTLLFDFGRYLLISSSRKGSTATNLQGIWNNSLTPPWRSGYTLNINTQMNYWPALMCGLEDCYTPLIDLIKTLSVSGTDTASRLYGARGFCVHHNSDIWGATTPVKLDARWGFWNGGGGWLCQHLFEYYKYTLDTDFLKITAFPIMKKGAEFYLDLLCERGDGHYSVILSTSPENSFAYIDGNGNKITSAVAKYTTMSDTIAFELFDNCLKCIDILGLDEPAFKAELENAVSKMDIFRIMSDGRLAEWNEEFGEPETTHRHISHLYGLHPASLITVKDTPELAKACKKTLEARGDGGTGWSLSWKVNCFARLNDGNHALKLLNLQLNPVDSLTISYEAQGGTYPNLFDAHPPFQIDGNFGVVSGILEMLARVADEGVELLPALPDAWKNGSLKGLRIKGNKILDLEWKDGKVSFVKEYEV